MHQRLAEARDAVLEAREFVDESDVQAQLASIREGIERVDDGAADSPAGDGVGDEGGDPVDDAEAGDRLESIERQIVALADEVDGLAETHLSTARDEIDAFRRESAPEWEDRADDERDGT